MTLYPCTKQPHCPLGRRNCMPTCPSRIIHYNNGRVKSVCWNPGYGPGGLLSRDYFSSGQISDERWEPGKGPNCLKSRGYYKNGNV